MRSLLSFDLRDAWRALRATPVLTMVTVLSLALGIGGTAALFSILNALVLRPLPVEDPARLALVANDSWTNPIWEEIKARQTQIAEGAFAWSNERFNLAEAGETRLVDGAYVSGEMFEVLGVDAAIGRTISPADDIRGSGSQGVVAVISHSLWQRSFGGARDVIGRRLTVNGRPATIIGVAVSRFLGPEVGRSIDVYLPLGAEAALKGPASALDQRANWWLNIMLRLRQSQTPGAAAVALNQYRPTIRRATIPENWNESLQRSYLSTDFAVVEASNGRSTLRQRFARPLTVIMTIVGGVLLIACANIVNLTLARSSTRRHDMSVRLALGASRSRLTRQLLVESSIVSVAGVAAALLFAQWSSALLLRQIGSAALDLAIDWRVLAFASGIGLGTTLLFGLVPAASLFRVAPQDALAAGSRGVVGGRGRFRGALVVMQLAFSLALVVTGTLFVRTFASLVTTPLGFDPARLLIVTVDAQRSVTTSHGDRSALFQRVVDAARATPGVANAAVSFMTPLSNNGWNDRINLPDRPDLTPQQRTFYQNATMPGWFETYGMRLLAGRDFRPEDAESGDRPVIVNETFARRFMGRESPVGTRLRIGGLGVADPVLIVGVTNDAIYRDARRGIVPTLYMPMAQGAREAAGFSLTVRTHGDIEPIKRALGQSLLSVDSGLSFSFRDYSEQIGASVSQERLMAMLSGFFGVLALLLAGLGLYGVTSYGVSRRRGEIAVRMALGARPSGVVRLVLGRVGVLLALGIIAGIGLSLWIVKFVGSLLFNLDQHDPVTFVGCTLVLAVVGFFAGWLPALRAARTSPMEALRN